MDRADDGCTVTQLLEPPLVVDTVIVPAAQGREPRAVQDASLFADFTRRWVRHQGTVVPDTAVLEAKLCRVGLLGSQGRVILPAERPPQLYRTGGRGCSRRKTYRRWLKQTVASR